VALDLQSTYLDISGINGQNVASAAGDRLIMYKRDIRGMQCSSGCRARDSEAARASTRATAIGPGQVASDKASFRALRGGARRTLRSGGHRETSRPHESVIAAQDAPMLYEKKMNIGSEVRLESTACA
jgi:hypothetical protein